jgi:hypothetical protein
VRYNLDKFNILDYFFVFFFTTRDADAAVAVAAAKVAPLLQLKTSEESSETLLSLI